MLNAMVGIYKGFIIFLKNNCKTTKKEMKEKNVATSRNSFII